LIFTLEIQQGNLGYNPGKNVLSALVDLGSICRNFDLNDRAKSDIALFELVVNEKI